jgi:hypothetical protein
MTDDSATPNRILDQLRYAAATITDTLAFRAVRLRSAIDGDDCDTGLLLAVLEDSADIRECLENAVAACTDKPDEYSDGTKVFVFTCWDEDWRASMEVQEPPREPK